MCPCMDGYGRVNDLDPSLPCVGESIGVYTCFYKILVQKMKKLNTTANTSQHIVRTMPTSEPWHKNLYSPPQLVRDLPSIQGWQALSLPVWKYSGTDQQPQTCGPSCTALTGRMEHLQWETQRTHVGTCQVWRQWLSIQWPSLPSLTAQCVQISQPLSLSTQIRVSDSGIHVPCNVYEFPSASLPNYTPLTICTLHCRVPRHWPSSGTKPWDSTRNSHCHLAGCSD